jgi:hypothetical protein
VVGVALLLAGIGFVVLALVVLGVRVTRKLEVPAAETTQAVPSV